MWLIAINYLNRLTALIYIYISLCAALTLSGHYEAGHAVRYTGARCQECDAHDDVRDTQREANHSHLTQNIVISQSKSPDTEHYY